MADNQQTKQAERSPYARATRLEVYHGYFLIWIFLSFALRDPPDSEFAWVRPLMWAVSFLMVLVYGVISTGMWWVGRREKHRD